MMNLIPKFMPRVTDEQRRAKIYTEILRYEAKIGGQLFGPLPVGHKREFFCLDKYTWVWHEEWIDTAGKRQVVATHYTLRQDGILKSQNNHSYQEVHGTELRNLCTAIEQYCAKMPALLRGLTTA